MKALRALWECLGVNEQTSDVEFKRVTGLRIGGGGGGGGIIKQNIHAQLSEAHYMPGGGGGGGYSEYIYWRGCVLAHQKKWVLGAGTGQKGDLRCGHSPKKGVLGAGTAQKRGF